jgi:hypothetical protein
MVHVDKLPFFAFGCLGANKVPKKAKLANSNNYINMLLYKFFQLTSPKVEFITLVIAIIVGGYLNSSWDVPVSGIALFGWLYFLGVATNKLIPSQLKFSIPLFTFRLSFAMIYILIKNPPPEGVVLDYPLKGIKLPCPLRRQGSCPQLSLNTRMAVLPFTVPTKFDTETFGDII